MELEEEGTTNWYDEFEGDDEAEDVKELTPEEVTSLRIEAQNILEDETKRFLSKKQGGKKKSKEDWIKTVLAKGTASDKVSALALTIINAPMYNLSALTSLINMVKVSKKRQCTDVINVLSRLFLENLLKPDKKLKTFDKQPLSLLGRLSNGNALNRRLRLCAWIFEDRLKGLYEQFIKAIEAVAKDTIETNREKAISAMQHLLSSNPEQEQALLSGLVNKMGDPCQKVASKVIYCLTQVLREHPKMKQVVMEEVERLLFRSNISPRTQYYAVCFLSQFVFTSDDLDVARNLINIYFAFFKASIKKGEIDSRLMGALLMGVKRAFPFAKLQKDSDDMLTQHVNTLYKLVHVSNFNIALHTLCLLQQVSSAMEDRFYSALFKKLLDSKLSLSTHHAILINLIYKGLINDENTNRVKAMVKRLLQVCLQLPVPLICALLYMLSQIFRRKRTILAVETTAVETVRFEDDDDTEEKYIDADKEEEDNEAGPSDSKDKKPHGWCFREMFKMGRKKSGAYDPWARNPAFANADKTAYFELLKLTEHFHPTVSLFASKLLNGEPIVYSGDPLVDFTLVRFLERFVFKNPKKNDNVVEKKQTGPDPNLAMRKYYAPSGVRALSVTSEAYLKLNETNVPVEELFLHRYLKERYGTKGIVKKEEDDDDNSSVASEDFEEMLQSLMNKSGKQVDFMEEIGDSLVGKNKSSLDEDEESEGTEEEEEGDEEDPEDMKDLSDVEDGEDIEVMDFSSDGEEQLEEDLDLDKVLNERVKEKMHKITNPKKKKKQGLESLFAPAEEFSEILDEAGVDTVKPGMAGTLLNPDNAAQKQINWEKTRNRWVKGIGGEKRKKTYQKKFSKGKKKQRKR